MRDNIYIRRFYRPQMTNSELFTTIPQCHTETGNIWTMLAPSLIILKQFIDLLQEPSNSWHDIERKFMLSIFLVCEFASFFVSSLYHTLQIESPKALCWWSRADYSGVSVLLMGKVIPLTYYIFYCEQFYQRLYLATSTVFNSAMVVLLMAFKSSSKPEYKALRPVAVTITSAFNAMPLIHGIKLHGYQHLFSPERLAPLIPMGGLYVLGGFFFASKYPEKKWPGKFDLVGHSHQLFHICVAAASVFFYQGLNNVASARLSMKSACGF